MTDAERRAAIKAAQRAAMMREAARIQAGLPRSAPPAGGGSPFPVGSPSSPRPATPAPAPRPVSAPSPAGAAGSLGRPRPLPRATSSAQPRVMGQPTTAKAPVKTPEDIGRERRDALKKSQADAEAKKETRKEEKPKEEKPKEEKPKEEKPKKEKTKKPRGLLRRALGAATKLGGVVSAGQAAVGTTGRFVDFGGEQFFRPADSTYREATQADVDAGLTKVNAQGQEVAVELGDRILVQKGQRDILEEDIRAITGGNEYIGDPRTAFLDPTAASGAVYAATKGLMGTKEDLERVTRTPAVYPKTKTDFGFSAPTVLRIAQARGKEGRDKYLKGLEYKPVGSDDRYFLGRADDPEFSEVEKGVLVTGLQDKYSPFVEQRAAQQAQIAEDKNKVFFDQEDRKAFLKAAKSGDLVKMFDTDNDEALSKEERSLFFDREQGFLAGGPNKMMPETPDTGAADYGKSIARDAIYGETSPVMLDPSYLEDDPPTTMDYANMMRQAIGNDSITVDERNDVMRSIRESMVDQGLTTPAQFNRIGRQMLQDAAKRKEQDRIDYLRSPEASEYIATPGLDALAEMQSRPFGTNTALSGSVGSLKDAPRQLGTRAGAARRRARELEGMGYRREAGALRSAAAMSTEPRLKSQADVLQEERKKREMAAFFERRRKSAMMEQEGEKAIGS